jgi:hypothetical protein
MIGRRLSNLRRILKRVQLGGPCWPYEGVRNALGQYMIEVPGQITMVENLFWEELFGPVPRSHVLIRTCQTPNCVNFSHMELRECQPAMVKPLHAV